MILYTFSGNNFIEFMHILLFQSYSLYIIVEV